VSDLDCHRLNFDSEQIQCPSISQILTILYYNTMPRTRLHNVAFVLLRGTDCVCFTTEAVPKRLVSVIIILHGERSRHANEWMMLACFPVTTSTVSSNQSYILNHIVILYEIKNEITYSISLLPGGHISTVFSTIEVAWQLIRLKRIYNFWCSMLVFTLFALYFITLRGIFMRFPELTY
jgi:hypothetical protein